MSSSRVVLLVEDNAAEVALMQEAFAELPVRHELRVVRDGEAALSYLRRRGEFAEAPVPDLVLLDLNLPRLGGLEVLEQVKTDDALRFVPVVVLSTSDHARDVRAALARQANAYLTKPMELAEFFGTVSAIDEFWLRRAARS